MSVNYGFVYVLSNPLMDGVYKIGMTDRAPSQRVAELSKSTSVPAPFEIILCAEVFNAAHVESLLHEKFSRFRINQSREFFCLLSCDLFELRDEIRCYSCGIFHYEACGVFDEVLK